MNIRNILGKIAVVAGIAGVGIGQSATPDASRPTHYFYTPTAYVNEAFDVVASLHEASFALPHNFQLHTSFMDNVGRLCFGGRYGILDNLSVGAGMAWSITSIMGRPYGGHAIHHDYNPRFGVHLAWGPVIEDAFEMSIVPGMQLGEHFSAGPDIGMMITPSDFWSIIGEFGFSYDFTDREPYFNTIFGARVHPPQIPFLSFDAGVDFVENNPDNFAKFFAPYFDVIFAIKTEKYMNR